MKLEMIIISAAVIISSGCASEVRGHGRPDSHQTQESGVDSAPLTAATRVFDAADLDRDIAAQYADKFGELIPVHCPADQPAVAGTRFTCIIEGSDGKIQVEVTSNDGDYTWQPSG